MLNIAKMREYFPHLFFGGLIFFSMITFATLSVHYSSEVANGTHRVVKELRKIRRLYYDGDISNLNVNNLNESDWGSDKMSTANFTFEY